MNSTQTQAQTHATTPVLFQGYNGDLNYFEDPPFPSLFNTPAHLHITNIPPVSDEDIGWTSPSNTGKIQLSTTNYYISPISPQFTPGSYANYLLSTWQNIQLTDSTTGAIQQLSFEQRLQQFQLQLFAFFNLEIQHNEYFLQASGSDDVDYLVALLKQHSPTTPTLTTVINILNNPQMRVFNQNLFDPAKVHWLIRAVPASGPPTPIDPYYLKYLFRLGMFPPSSNPKTTGMIHYPLLGLISSPTSPISSIPSPHPLIPTLFRPN